MELSLRFGSTCSDVDGGCDFLDTEIKGLVRIASLKIICKKCVSVHIIINGKKESGPKEYTFPLFLSWIM